MNTTALKIVFDTNILIATNAICLVSNDYHFQILKTIDFPKVVILKLAEFEEKYKKQLIEDSE